MSDVYYFDTQSNKYVSVYNSLLSCIKKELIESDISAKDLRIALDIVDKYMGKK